MLNCAHPPPLPPPKFFPLGKLAHCILISTVVTSEINGAWEVCGILNIDLSFLGSPRQLQLDIASRYQMRELFPVGRSRIEGSL